MSDSINDQLTSGSHYSYWNESSALLEYKTLQSNLITDVLIVGGGIAGVTTAYCLAKSGRKVVLLEDGCLGSGETGRTTAQITYALDDRYYDLIKIFGEEKARLAAESHKHAIQWIKSAVVTEGIDCNYKDADGFLFLDPTDKPENLEKELEATQKLGLPTQVISEIPGLPLKPNRQATRLPYLCNSC